MMINRLRVRTGEPDEPRPPDDYYEIRARFETYYVSRQVAERVLRELGRAWPPQWIAFTDLAASRVRIRSRLIDCVQECRGAHRVAMRAFHGGRPAMIRLCTPPALAYLGRVTHRSLPVDVRWDIRREGRAWTAEEFRSRIELLPEKLEVFHGKLLWSDEDRLTMLGLLLEQVGADEAVKLGDRWVWIAAMDKQPRRFLDDPHNRWWVRLMVLQLVLLVAVTWLAEAVAPPSARLAILFFSVVVGVGSTLATRLFLDGGPE